MEGKRGWGALGDWDRHIYTTICKKDTSGELPYSTGSLARCSVMTVTGGMGSGREAQEGGMCLCI